jgi:hypothetical protein
MFLFQLKSGMRCALRTPWLRFTITLFLVVSLFPFLVSYADTSEDVIEEYQIKAVYLFNFALFFTWQDFVFKHPRQPFRFCVLGKDPFGIDLDIVLENEIVEGRSVTVQRLSTVYRSAGCQILFVSQSEKSRLRTILAYLKRYPILSVSDIKGFVRRGGMIEFFNTPYNEVRFIIAPETVDEAHLIASANLLEIAEIFYRRR